VIDVTALRATAPVAAEHSTPDLGLRAPDVRLVNHATARARLAVKAFCAATTSRGQVAAQQVKGK